MKPQKYCERSGKMEKSTGKVKEFCQIEKVGSLKTEIFQLLI